MKKISVIVPCYNEENSIDKLYERVTQVFHNDLGGRYEYEIIFSDDLSVDQTRDEIKKLCRRDQNVKAVFNVKNFGFHRNIMESFTYASGDCAFLIFGDLQDPPEILPIFIQEWEKGYKCIVGQRRSSSEKAVMRLFRKLYYKMIDFFGDTSQVQYMNGFGLYDRKFLDVISRIEEVSPYFKSVIAEYGMELKVVQYEQSAGMRGKSNFNFLKNYDFAMHGLTTSTKLLMRISTFVGIFTGGICILIACWVFINKLISWDTYPIGIASVLVGVFFIGAVQLFFIGILGEYILNINDRISRKPRIIVEQKINFTESEDDGGHAKAGRN